jgi:hypothetical protein
MRDSMRSPPWKALVTALTDSGHQSPYLDRLRQRLDVEQAHATLEREIVQEIAAALGRTASKLDHALLELELAGKDLDAAVTPDERAACAARFDALRAHALRARHELLIHREAVGIRRNDVLEQLYPVPPRRGR